MKNLDLCTLQIYVPCSHSSMSEVEPVCFNCKRSNPKEEHLTNDCGHHVHLWCLGRYLIDGYRVVEQICPTCNAYLSELFPYADILREAGMSDSEEFYLRISGTTVMSGLVKYLMDAEGDTLEKVLERTNSIFEDGINWLLPNRFDIFKHALLIGNGRIVKFLMLKHLGYECQISDDYFEKAWQSDHMELINDINEIGVYPLTYKPEKVPIIFAAKTGNYKLMKRLLDAGADKEKKHKELSPLTAVCQSDDYINSEEKIKFINRFWKSTIYLKHDKSTVNNSPFLTAVHKNDTKLVDYLMQKCSIRNNENDVDLIADVIKHGNIEIMKVFYKNCLEIERFYGFLERLLNKNSLKVALGNGLFEMSKLLIEYGVDPRAWRLISEFDFSKIQMDDSERIDEILEYFLTLQPNINENVGYAFNSLCKNDKNLPVIEKLVQLGARVYLDLLLDASSNGCINIIKYLLRQGAYPAVSNCSNKNFYLSALEGGNLDAVKIALPFCDKNSVRKYDGGPFYYIIRFKSEQVALEAFDYLADLGVKMDILDDRKEHPMTKIYYHNIYEGKPLLVQKYCEWEKRVGSNVIEEILKSESDEKLLKLYQSAKKKCENQII